MSEIPPITDFQPLPKPRISIGGLVRHAAALTGISAAEIAGKGRFRHLVDVRGAVVLVVREQMSGGLPVYSFPTIGARLGGRDHSTVIHALHRAEALVRRDAEFAALVSALRAAAQAEPLGPEIAPPTVAFVSPEPPVVLEEPDDEGEDADPAHAVGVAGRRFDYQTVRCSVMLLEALQREHPERMPAVGRFAAPRADAVPALRAGCSRGPTW